MTSDLGQVRTGGPGADDLDRLVAAVVGGDRAR